MPIYEYKCERCGKEFERVVFSSDSDHQACPVCGCAETRKLVSVFASRGLSREAVGGCSHGSHGPGHS
jgi:putative FmdB family regulatory protein